MIWYNGKTSHVADTVDSTVSWPITTTGTPVVGAGPDKQYTVLEAQSSKICHVCEFKIYTTWFVYMTPTVCNAPVSVDSGQSTIVRQEFIGQCKSKVRTAAAFPGSPYHTCLCSGLLYSPLLRLLGNTSPQWNWFLYSCGVYFDFLLPCMLKDISTVSTDNCAVSLTLYNGWDTCTVHFYVQTSNLINLWYYTSRAGAGQLEFVNRPKIPLRREKRELAW